jgi:hypothetical protein
MAGVGRLLQCVASVWLALAWLVPTLAHALVMRVTNASDSGPGSLRAAVEAANSNRAVNAIWFAQRALSIELQSGLEYTGIQPLYVEGLGATVRSAVGGSFPILVSSGGASLYLRSLTLSGAGAQGLLVTLPANARGMPWLRLVAVSAAQNAGCGVEIDDRAGSPAGIGLLIWGGTFNANGSGLCVEEIGAGHLLATVHAALFNGNGEDGAELLESGAGSVVVTLSGVRANANGFVDPGQPGGGFEISELDAGEMRALVSGGSFDGNAGDGIALDESGDGSAVDYLVRVSAINNGESGVVASESDAGNILVNAVVVIATGNGDDGIALRELGSGLLRAMIASSRAASNGGNGIEAVQQMPGIGTLLVSRSTVSGNTGEQLAIDGVSLSLR